MDRKPGKHRAAPKKPPRKWHPPKHKHSHRPPAPEGFAAAPVLPDEPGEAMPTFTADTANEETAAPPPIEKGADGALPQVVLKPNEDRRVRRGHLWIFSNEVAAAPAEIGAGDTVHFLTARKELLGVGCYNPHSLIAGRLFDRRHMALDVEFFKTRLQRAQDLRRAVYRGDAYRWTFGESDDLPGLVIDRYGDVCVIESFCAGIDKLMAPILEAVKTFHPWKAVVLRNDMDIRKLEHLPQEVTLAEGAVDTPHWFELDGLKVAADVMKGQKTGFFFDQRDNRATVAGYADGRRVLDLFCHTGGFGLWCAKAGATSVMAVDQSEPALELGHLIAEKNGLDGKFRFEKANVFEWLNTAKDKYDIVVCDPPRFAASRKNVPQAIQAYAHLNAAALKRVTGGGFLATASCSSHIERDTFRQILSRAAYMSGRRVRLLAWGGQAKDHPVRLSMPETEYLKFALLQVS